MDRVSEDLNRAVQLFLTDDGRWREDEGVGLHAAEESSVCGGLQEAASHPVGRWKAGFGRSVGHKLHRAHQPLPAYIADVRVVVERRVQTGEEPFPLRRALRGQVFILDDTQVPEGYGAGDGVTRIGEGVRPHPVALVEGCRDAVVDADTAEWHIA